VIYSLAKGVFMYTPKKENCSAENISGRFWCKFQELAVPH
jgi:hypothetical protein